MRGLCLIALFLAPDAMSRGAESSEAPVLQWFTALGGSGTSTATAVAADSLGNLYIAGNTTSLDLPTVAATQAHPGGSTLVRIDPASGATQNIYFQGITGEGAVQSVAADPGNPQSVYATASGGVFHSQDGGNTWTRLVPIPSNPTVWSLTVDPTNSNTLYASTSPAGALQRTGWGCKLGGDQQGRSSGFGRHLGHLSDLGGSEVAGGAVCMLRYGAAAQRQCGGELDSSSERHFRSGFRSIYGGNDLCLCQLGNRREQG